MSHFLASLSMIEDAEELRRISRDRREFPQKRAAAFYLLVMSGEESVPHPKDRLAYAESYMDRTEGRPIQTQRLEGDSLVNQQIVLDKTKWDATKSLPTERRQLAQASQERTAQDDEAGVSGDPPVSD